MTTDRKVLIISYYWPPAGGSGVQRWMYFAKYLKELGWEPIVLTVDEKKAAYPVLDQSLMDEVAGIRVLKTTTRGPLRYYSSIQSGSPTKGLPQGEISTESYWGKLTAFIRGNFFIPDARKGWVPFAVRAAQKLLNDERITHLITTGPPHSTHLAGLQLAKQYSLNWWVDYRDPWTTLFYNRQLYRTEWAKKRDQFLEQSVLRKSNGIITTVSGDLEDYLKSIVPQKPLVILPNGYDETLMQSLQVTKPSTVFHIVYTGLLTENQNYQVLLDVLLPLSRKHSIRLSLAGSISPSILTKIKKSLPQVETVFHGYLSHKAAIGLMKQGHLLLNFIFKGANTQMISGKLLEYLATAVPVLSIGDPNTAAGQFLNQGSYSVMLAADCQPQITQFIEQLLEKKGKAINTFPQLKSLTRKALTEKLIQDVFLTKY